MKKGIILLILIISINSMQAQESGDGFSKQVENNNEFTFDLYKYINADNDNLFISPFSVSSALAMTYEGAREKTREEMSEIMHFPLDNTAVNQDFKDIISRAQSSKDSKHYIFNIANSIWAQKKYDFLQRFFDVIKEYYKAPVNLVDFEDPENREKVRIKINDWTAKKTNDKIKDLLDKGTLDKDTKMVLVNAVYFLAQWNMKFSKKATKQDDFYALKGKTQKDFMRKTMRLNYTKTKDLQLIEIPYKNNKASMIILLPDSSSKFSAIKESLSNKYFNDIYSTAKLRNVNAIIPKFKIEYKNDLSKTLYEAGMKRPFTTKADFSGMVCDDDVRIDKIIHQTFINVDEEGTEAAAATAVVMKRVTSIGPNDQVEFKADHPFIFLIKENSTNSILFIGQLMK